MKVAIIINAVRLTDELKDQLNSKKLTEAYQIDYDVYFPQPKEIESALKEVKEKTYQAYLIGGGDGTVRQVVEILGNDEIPIMILPLGTFNLFAKSLELPNSLEKTFEIIKNNKTKLVDLICVNNTAIINHAWVGFYFNILKERKKHRSFLGKSRLLKLIFSTLVLFRPLPVHTLTFESEGEKITYATCLVYVGNNDFYTSLFHINERKTLSSGLMSVTILNVQSRWQLFLCLVDLIFKNIQQSKRITYFCTNEFSIESKGGSINVVIDGELFNFPSPLHFRNNQKKIKVFIP